jgi:hypothetical protein
MKDFNSGIYFDPFCAFATTSEYVQKTLLLNSNFMIKCPIFYTCMQIYIVAKVYSSTDSFHLNRFKIVVKLTKIRFENTRICHIQEGPICGSFEHSA